MKLTECARITAGYEGEGFEPSQTTELTKAKETVKEKAVVKSTANRSLASRPF
jgi:hypothetical protein